MQNKFVLDVNSKHILAGKTLLLDTNALLDAYRLSDEFYTLLEEFVNLGCDITTTRTIVIEFLGGTKDSDIINAKAEFLQILFGKKLENDNFYLPINNMVPSLDTFLTFSRQANKFSPADFEIYRMMKKYKNNLLLVSRNHKDFSTTIAERISFITLLGVNEIHTYGVYRAKA